MSSSANQLKQQTFSKAIVYGTISYQLGANKRGNDKSTHRWCVYVRGPNGEDLSTFIEKVVFVLHETFPDYQRAISKPPFEVIEKGWGEFDIIIQIHFKAHYPHLELVHKLKFYGAKTGGSSQGSKKPVVSEFYDEIVFVNPSIEFSELLREVKYLSNSDEKLEILDTKEASAMEEEGATGASQPADQEEEKFDWKMHYLKFDAADHHTKLEDALAVVKLENEKCQGENEKYDKELEQLQLEIDSLQKQYEAQQSAAKAQIEQEQLLLNQNSLLPPQNTTPVLPTTTAVNNSVQPQPANSNVNIGNTDSMVFQPQSQQQQPQYYPGADDRIILQQQQQQQLIQQQQQLQQQPQQLIQQLPRQPSNTHYITPQPIPNNLNNPPYVPNSLPPQVNSAYPPPQPPQLQQYPPQNYQQPGSDYQPQQ